MAAGAKSETTRQRLVETATALFRTQGYERTTMRGIAEAAGVSVGNAYYYFPSKESLVGELYRSLQDEHRSRALPLLRAGHNLGEHLRVILQANLDVLGPYHSLGHQFLKTAALPVPRTSRYPVHSSSNPAADLPQDAAQVGRGKSIAVYRQAVQAARPQPPLAIRDDLPDLLWLVHMGLTLFWVYDSSPGQARSRRLVNNTAPLVAKLVILSRLPVVRNIVEDVVKLLRGARVHD
ncbi:TetR/AcrR family transcriptional regulator [Arthrobacter caoxuetaonis]|uniref:TetR/AcrR family transcriptional regulator n=1 Tax=Arthrobacter caoxuetaonis TaxID=2886935 RepID=A0A9X1SCP1_9MICC|nr:TetR family transcriptional regulator [Arthrobacter caoxuetaonis]MCC3298378.1 TetR/AcrR family transcriptional regulator [Arthrobacter caoxuetaonis]USQ57606.1 TetR/AcrR family transcriptional regulator [Arthrobacter caoxuetaonis]